MNKHLLPPEHVAKVCRLGEAGCCAYLASVRVPEFFCGKQLPDLVVEIRRRLADATIGATGDNCSGPPDYVPSPSGAS